MTLREFYAKVRGFEWKRTMEARNRAEIIAAIGNFSGNLRKGSPPMRPDRMVQITNPPLNIFFRRLFDLPL